MGLISSICFIYVTNCLIDLPRAKWGGGEEQICANPYLIVSLYFSLGMFLKIWQSTHPRSQA